MMKKLSKLLKKHNSGGFTLVEVVIATALLGILIIGVLLFMTPVFGMLDTNENAAKADRAMSTVETYVSKSLRRSIYVKVFTGGDDTDITSTSGAIFTDADYTKMVEFMNKPGNKDRYTLNCLSIRYEVDNNPRNRSENNNARKYMLHNETINTTHYLLETSETELVFDESFYEDIYPSFDLSVVSVDFDSSGNVIPETVAPGATPVTPAVTRTPGIIMDMSVFSDETMHEVYRIFTGKSIIECNNIKSAEANPKGDYKIFDITELTTGKNIYIFYITRNLNPVTASPP